MARREGGQLSSRAFPHRSRLQRPPRPLLGLPLWRASKSASVREESAARLPTFFACHLVWEDLLLCDARLHDCASRTVARSIKDSLRCNRQRAAAGISTVTAPTGVCSKYSERTMAPKGIPNVGLGPFLQGPIPISTNTPRLHRPLVWHHTKARFSLNHHVMAATDCCND